METVCHRVTWSVDGPGPGIILTLPPFDARISDLRLRSTNSTNEHDCIRNRRIFDKGLHF